MNISTGIYQMVYVDEFRNGRVEKMDKYFKKMTETATRASYLHELPVTIRFKAQVAVLFLFILFAY
jgi:hypothetical protein